MMKVKHVYFNVRLGLCDAILVCSDLVCAEQCRTLGPSLVVVLDPNKNFHVLFSDRSVKEM